jgi:hypothetical protein
MKIETTSKYIIPKAFGVPDSLIQQMAMTKLSVSHLKTRVYFHCGQYTEIVPVYSGAVSSAFNGTLGSKSKEHLCGKMVHAIEKLLKTVEAHDIPDPSLSSTYVDEDVSPSSECVLYDTITYKKQSYTVIAYKDDATLGVGLEEKKGQINFLFIFADNVELHKICVHIGMSVSIKTYGGRHATLSLDYQGSGDIASRTIGAILFSLMFHGVNFTSPLPNLTKLFSGTK